MVGENYKTSQTADDEPLDIEGFNFENLNNPQQNYGVRIDVDGKTVRRTDPLDVATCSSFAYLVVEKQTDDPNQITSQSK